MDNVKNCDSYISIIFSQIYRSYWMIYMESTRVITDRQEQQLNYPSKKTTSPLNPFD
jgi:hypothetical protein